MEKAPLSFDVGAGASLMAGSALTRPKEFTLTGLVLTKSDSGAITSLKGTLGSVPIVDGKLTEPNLAQTLAKIPSNLGVNSGDLKLERFSKDISGNIHAHYEETKNGLKVIGARTTVQLNQVGLMMAIERTPTNFEALSAKETKPKITVDAAKASARTAAKPGEELSTTPTDPSLVYIISTVDQSEHLAYEVRVSGHSKNGPVVDNVYVDAVDGKVVDRHALLQYLSQLTIFDAHNADNLPGTQVQVNGAPITSDTTVNFNFGCLDKVRNFYSEKFQRDSLDNQGEPLVSSVHYEVKLGNAYWRSDIQQMVFGDGDENLVNLAQSLEVTAHELTHGVTAHSSKLVGANEPGALNEAISDIMATYCKYWDGSPLNSSLWLFGSTVMSPSGAAALRYMADPTEDHHSFDYYPDLQASVAADPWSQANDVHYACGIVNLAYKLMVTGGPHPHPRGATAVNVPSIGIDAATRIFYDANENYLAPGSTFRDARDATIKSAKSLQTQPQPHVNYPQAVAAAWDAVGVPPGNESP